MDANVIGLSVCTEQTLKSMKERGVDDGHVIHINRSVVLILAVHLQTWSGPGYSRKLRFPDFVTTAQDDGTFVSLTHRPPLLPGNAAVIHVSSRLNRPQGHSANGRNLCQ